jgi:hypothetical protein
MSDGASQEISVQFLLMNYLPPGSGSGVNTYG